MLLPTPANFSVHLPFLVLICIPTRPVFSCAFSYKAIKAFLDFKAYVAFPVNEDNMPNSMYKEPPPAVLAMSVSPTGTPDCKFTVPMGMPVTVSNAGNIRSATSTANRNNSSL